MKESLRELTLAALHNNEIIMQQTEDIAKATDGNTQATASMQKIYNAITDKIKTAPETLTTADCRFMVIQLNITLASLYKQERTIKLTIEAFEQLKDLYQDAGESPENLADFLKHAFEEEEEEDKKESDTLLQNQ